MILAEWIGGPWDGRADVLPDGVSAVSVAMPMCEGFDELLGDLAFGYYEVRCSVIQNEDGEYLIIWHEPE